MRRTILDTLEGVSCKIENIISTMTLLTIAAGDKTATW